MDKNAAQPGPRLNRRKFLGGALAAGVLSPIIAACSSGSPAATSTTSGQAAGKKTATVRLGYSSNGVTATAKNRGVFVKSLAAQGIKVTWVGPFPNHAPSIQAVEGNSADLSFGGSSTVALAAIEAGGSLKLTSFISANIRTTSILVLPKSGITSVPGLVGKKIAVNKSGLGQFIAVAALEKYNIPLSKVTFVYLDPGDAGPAFYSGKVDAWSIFGDTVQVAEANYGAEAIFTDSKDLPSQLDYETFVTRADYAASNGATLKAVLNAYQVEQTWLNDHFDESVDQNAKVEKLSAKAIALIKQQEQGTITTLDAPFSASDVSKLQASANWQTSHGVLPKHIDVAQYALTSF
jgi:sulfonate transport system substrate-binding protein